MLALWIILALLALLALACCLSVVLYVDIGESTRIQAGVGGVRFTLVDTRPESPRQKVKAFKKQQKKQEKQAKKEAKKKEKQKKSKEKALRKKRAAAKAKKHHSSSAKSAQTSSGQNSRKKEEKEDGFSATVKEVLALIRRCFPHAGYILRHLRLRRVVIAINVGAEDAHATALRYGQVQAAVNTALATLTGYGADIQLQALCIQPDFVTGEFRQWISFRMKLRVGVIILGGLGILGKIIGYFLADSSSDRPSSGSSKSKPQTQKPSAGQAVKENVR